jgi:hypothetical protein
LLQVSLAVYRERMMYGGYDWYLQPFHQQEPVTQALIIMNNVETALFTKLFQLGISPEAKCPGFGEDSQAAGAKFIQVNGVPDFGEVPPERASRVIYARAFELVQDNALAHFGEGCAGDYLHLMTHPLKLARQVVDINTLPAAVRIPPISEQADSHIFYSDSA